MPGRLDFSFSFGGSPARDLRREPEDPCHIVVIGDFSGRTDRGLGDGPLRIDLDDFDEVFTRLQPRVDLPFGAKVLPIEFRDLDDFHPDALLQRLPALAAVRAEAKALRDPARSAAMLASLRPQSPAATPAAPASQDLSPFEQLLGQKREPAPGPVTGIDAWLTAIVQPHVAKAADPRAIDLAMTLDAASSALLREVLHHPQFQERETAWRGLRWLLQNIESDETLLVSVLDASLPALQAATADADLRRSPLHRLLVDRGGAGRRAYSLAVVLPTVRADTNELRTLAAFAALGDAGGFPVVATPSSAWLGIREWPAAGDPSTWQVPATLADSWAALRASPQARRLALVAPRFLLRLPYGPSTDPIDTFRFDELPEGLPANGAHERYSWGASGLAVAQLFAAAFRADGWDLDLAGHHEVTELPLHTTKVGGKVRMQPCAEVLLTERGLAAMAAAGLTVLQSHADRDAARLVRLRSIANGDIDLLGA